MYCRPLIYYACFGTSLTCSQVKRIGLGSGEYALRRREGTSPNPDRNHVIGTNGRLVARGQTNAARKSRIRRLAHSPGPEVSRRHSTQLNNSSTRASTSWPASLSAINPRMSRRVAAKCRPGHEFRASRWRPPIRLLGWRGGYAGRCPGRRAEPASARCACRSAVRLSRSSSAAAQAR